MLDLQGCTGRMLDPHLLWVRIPIPAWCQQSSQEQELNR